MKTKLLLLFIVGTVTVFFAYTYISTHIYSPQGNKIISIKIANQTFHVEIVSRGEKMQKGLGSRNGLCQSCGMLFQFPKPGKHMFWMKDMRFPIDIIWVRDGKIVHIENNVQSDFTGVLTPSGDSDEVLELNAGTAERFNLKIGDRVEM